MKDYEMQMGLIEAADAFSEVQLKAIDNICVLSWRALRPIYDGRADAMWAKAWSIEKFDSAIRKRKHLELLA